MNCQDVVAFVVEPAEVPESVREHLRTCGECRARTAESRRVATLLADLPLVPGVDVAARVMAHIGYGNGRPTREKILDQLGRIREELDAVIEEADGHIARRPSPVEGSVADIAAHLPVAEASVFGKAVVTNGEASSEDLRRVRERTLRLVSGLETRELDNSTAELLRSVYRHEADHVAQMCDTLWRLRRKDRLGESDSH